MMELALESSVACMELGNCCKGSVGQRGLVMRFLRGLYLSRIVASSFSAVVPGRFRSIVRVELELLELNLEKGISNSRSLGPFSPGKCRVTSDWTGERGG